jgi:membrane protein DedA with SNARE-associated domain
VRNVVFPRESVKIGWTVAYSRASALPQKPRRVYDTGRPVGSGRDSRRVALVRPNGDARLTEHLVRQLGYLGISLILILGGLGLPIPEEAPIILAAVLTRNGQMQGPLALASCLVGVILGDLVVYFLGFFYGEKVLSLPLTRRFLTRQREAQIKGYFHRHGFKILVSGRFVPGFRSAAYLTAGILKLPTLKLLMTDLVAASLTTCLMFGLGYAFAHQIQSGIREVQQWITVIVAVGVAVWLVIRYDKARRRAGRPVGPPVLDSDDVPLPVGERRGASRAPAPDASRDASSEWVLPHREAAGTHEPASAPASPGEFEPSTPTPSVAGPSMTAARGTQDSVMIELDPRTQHSSLESPLR